MKPNISLEKALLVLASALLAFAIPGFLADQAWAEDVVIQGQYSCEQIKTDCANAGGKYTVIDQAGGEKTCSCFTPCRSSSRGVPGCDVMCRAVPGKPGHCSGHVPDGILLGNKMTFSPAQILGGIHPSTNTPIMRRGVEGEQPDTGMANPAGTSPETK